MFASTENLAQIRVGWDSVAGSVHHACQPRSLTLKSVHPRVPVNKRQSQKDTLAEFIFHVPYSLGLQTFTLQRENVSIVLNIQIQRGKKTQMQNCLSTI